MAYYDDLVKTLQECTKTKHCEYAKRGQGDSRKVVNDLCSNVDNCIDTLIYIDENDGDKDLLELRNKLSDIEMRERRERNPFKTIIDIEQIIVPSLLNIMKRYKNIINEKQVPVWK